jgi:hypothetical protein
MGAMRFLVPRRECFPEDAANRAYLAGMDETPWLSRTQWTENGLVVQRGENDSGNFFIPALVAGHGELMLSTASLMERGEPYHLDVELARGTLNRLRNHIAGWESVGMTVRDDIRQALSTAHENFAWAATRKAEPLAASERAQAAITAALDAINLLASVFAAEAIALRRQQLGKLNTLVGCNLGSTDPAGPIGRALVPAFNCAAVPMVWRDIEVREGKCDWTLCDAQVEWCRSAGLRVISGPLLKIDKWSLPDWMYLFGADDMDSFRSCAAEHVAAVVNRYRGKVQLWQCAAGLNLKNDFSHDEEQRLRLAVLAVESIRSADPRTPIVLTIDQPWGSFMSRENYDLSPLHFVDALIRAEIGLSGIGLEINFGYASHASDSRDVLEFARQVDRFSLLGAPLLVVLTAPSAESADPTARVATRVLNYSGGAKLTTEAQAAWCQEYLSVLLAKQPVQAILWNQLSDKEPHAYPHGGVLDADNQPKPIAATLAKIREELLG